MNTDLLDNFPPREEKDLFDTLQFIKKSPFAKDYWQILKGLYKKAETYFLTQEKDDVVNPTIQQNVTAIVGHLLARIDQQKITDLNSKYPSKLTLAYMKPKRTTFHAPNGKKTTKKFIFNLRPQYYWPTKDRNPSDFENQWILADMILGNSKRCEQTGGGKGKYVFHSHKYNLNQREERASSIWDAHIAFVQSLLNKDLPWEIYEFAVKILSQNNVTIPTPDEVTLQTFFSVPSLWLKRLAVESAYQTFFVSRG